MTTDIELFMYISAAYVCASLMECTYGMLDNSMLAML